MMPEESTTSDPVELVRLFNEATKKVQLRRDDAIRRVYARFTNYGHEDIDEARAAAERLAEERG